MASEEHKQLANYIKNVHQTLRIESRKFGATEAWKKHCQQEEKLELYASAMHKLATEHWVSDDKKLANSRISWIVENALNYFMKGGKNKEKFKEARRKERINGEFFNHGESSNDSDIAETNFTLLDVGSCYNPFRSYPFFTVLPIDLKPACSEVFSADFLDLSLESQILTLEDIIKHSPIRVLPQNYFDIVVFSLLLEYMPSSEQRYICCEKAYSLLKPEGLLFIISPDSKHATANSCLMKNWRICLAQLGFTRIVYEKLPHIHCMMFRKNRFPIVSQSWARNQYMKQSKPVQMLEDRTYLCELMQIPQDNTNYSLQSESDCYTRNDQDDSVIVEMFEELPSVLDI